MTIPAYRLVETSAPGDLPVSLNEAKIHLRVDQDHDDALITGMIESARILCEQTTGLALISRNYDLYLDVWPGTSLSGWWDGVREGADSLDPVRQLNLPRPPLVSVTDIVTLDEQENETVFPAESYYVDTYGIPGRIVLKKDASPPLPIRHASGIRVAFTAGYGSAPENVPAALRHGILRIVAHLYQNRGDVPEQALRLSGADQVFQPFRLMRIS